MNCNIQCIPTPIQWVGRKKFDPVEIAGAVASHTVTFAWDSIFPVEEAPGPESAGALGGQSIVFGNGDTNVNAPSQSESSGVLSGSSVTFAWGSIYVLDTGGEQSIALAASPAFNWDFVIVNSPNQAETASALAAAPTFNNG